VDEIRTEYLEREAASWAAFEAALTRIPRERWAEEGVVPGWSVNDLLWHVAGWADRCAENLERMRDGESLPVEETDEQVEAMNEAFAAAAKGMDADAVWTGLVAARGLACRRFEELDEADPTAVEWFVGETYEHYEEHQADLERFAG
jgi:uncharacterized damage-inducible protein DinB